MKSDIRIGGLQLVGAEQPEPQFDCRQQLDDADDIIDWLRKPVPPRIGSRRKKPTPGAELRSHRESLAQFLAEIAEGYRLALDAYSLRNDPHRPNRDLDKNDSGDADAGFDYPDCVPSARDDLDWDAFWLETYGRKRGNPGANRSSDEAAPPIEPLRLNYPAITGWWKTATGGGFNPEFAVLESEDAAGEAFERNNPPARFLLLVARYLDCRYEAANVSGLYDTMRREHRRQQAKTNMSPRVRN